MPEVVFYGSAVIATILVSNLGLLVVRRRIPSHAVQPSHEVGGYLFAALATLYAVLLGLIVVDAMTKYQEASHIVEQESNCVAQIFFLASELPTEKRQTIQNLCKQYVFLVVDKEWATMDKHHYCPEARSTALTMVKSVIGFKPVNDAENTVYGAMLNEISDFWSARRSRILRATHGLPGMEWFVILAGGGATIVFTYFFGTENLRVQIAMTSMVAFLISLNLVLLAMFGQPFHGEYRVAPDSFHGDMRIFDGDLTHAASAENAT
ncbi:MAG: DUF4239 domain-containing protein [Candidatus Obscuribacterales bacterium]|nr:DUF4239 domain-containing protein [Candidatus Obscuribacterales bacterium]